MELANSITSVEHGKHKKNRNGAIHAARSCVGRRHGPASESRDWHRLIVQNVRDFAIFSADAIVRKALERMGGTSGVESRPGEGSRFWLELPHSGKGEE